jgi:hypothetical protein
MGMDGDDFWNSAGNSFLLTPNIGY